MGDVDTLTETATRISVPRIKEKTRHQGFFLRRIDDRQPLNKSVSHGTQEFKKDSRSRGGGFSEAYREGAQNAPLKLSEKIPVGDTFAVKLEPTHGFEKIFQVVKTPQESQHFNPDNYPDSIWVREIGVKELAKQKGQHFLENKLPLTNETLKLLGKKR